MLEILNFEYKRIGNFIVKTPCGILLCDNCNFYYNINDGASVFISLNNTICEYCKYNIDIYDNAQLFTVKIIEINNIIEIRKKWLMYNVIKQWKYFHNKFKILKKIIRNYIFIKYKYLNPYDEIGKIRLELIKRKWNKKFININDNS